MKRFKNMPPVGVEHKVEVEERYRSTLSHLRKAGMVVSVSHYLVPVKFRFAVEKSIRGGGTPAWLTMDLRVMKSRKLSPSSFGGRTVAIVYDGRGQIVAAGVARCSMSDVYNPLVGAYIALDRAYTDLVHSLPLFHSSIPEPAIDKLVHTIRRIALGDYLPRESVGEILDSMANTYGARTVRKMIESRLGSDAADEIVSYSSVMTEDYLDEIDASRHIKLLEKEDERVGV